MVFYDKVWFLSQVGGHLWHQRKIICHLRRFRYEFMIFFRFIERRRLLLLWGSALSKILFVDWCMRSPSYIVQSYVQLYSFIKDINTTKNSKWDRIWWRNFQPRTKLWHKTIFRDLNPIQTRLECERDIWLLY